IRREMAFFLSGRLSVTVSTAPSHAGTACASPGPAALALASWRPGDLLPALLAIVDLHAQQRRAQGLPLRIRLEADGAAASQGPPQQEIERVEVRQLEALHAAGDDAAEMLRDARGRQLAHEYRVPPRLAGDDADVGGVALVAAAGMRDIHQAPPHEGAPL